MLRRFRALAPLVALACTAGVLYPVAAQASGGVCLGRKVTATGTPESDPLGGGATSDVMAGLQGDDALTGAGGDDRLCGGTGNDFLLGGAGSDLLRGNEGDDVLIGGEGRDWYNGGPGNDICDLGPGDRSSGGCEATMEDDSDRDGLPNGAEVALRTNAFAADSDGDGTSDLDEAEEALQNEVAQADLDDDGDGVPNGVDNCAAVPNAGQENLDGALGDAQGDACDLDDDGDGVADETDNCAAAANPDQANLDKDELGDACDDDLDGDQISNSEDLCPTRMHGDRNYGGCPPLVVGDSDGDGVMDGADNCELSNPDQQDSDGNGVGDVCQDSDGDGIPNEIDNCPDRANPAQSDVNPKDGIGDACQLPTFQEFYESLVALGGPCPLGPELCELLVNLFYFLTYGQSPPPYVLPPGYFPPGCICICIIIGCGPGIIPRIGVI